MRRPSSLSLFVFTVAILLLTCPFTYGAETIRVGIVSTYSGAPSSLSDDVLDGFKLATGKINGEGGVLGRQIVVVTVGGKEEAAAGAARSLVRAGKADVLLATLDRQSAFDFADLAAKERIPLLVAFSERPVAGAAAKNRYIFNIGETPAMAGTAAGVMFHERPYEKFWILGDDDDYGHAFADGFWGMLHKLEPTFELKGQTWWKSGETNYGPAIANAMAAKPDCVVVATRPSNVGAFQKAAKASGLSGKIPFYQNWASEHSVLADQGSDAEEGVLGTTSYLFYSPATPANKAFTEEFHAAYHRYPGSGAFYGFVAAKLIAEGYRKAGAVDAERLITSLEGMRVETPLGNLAMRPCDHQLGLPVFLCLTGRVRDFPNFLATVSLQSLGPAYYMGPCEEGPKVAKK